MPPENGGISASASPGDDTGRAGSVRIRTLGRELMRVHIDEAVALDRAARTELGDAYSHESWTREAFLAERPAKWRLSGAALIAHRIVGLLVASASGDELHLHRMVVAPEARRLRVALLLMTRAECLARQAGLISISLSVSAGNTHALAFYSRAGFAPLRGEDLRTYADARGLPVDGDTVRPAGHAYQILRKLLGQKKVG